MHKTIVKVMAGTALAAILSLGHPALAQDVDFGDDSSTFSNDGQCDDPRFEGPGAALFRSPLDTLRDATDCSAALEAGEVTLAEQDAAEATPASEAGDIDFGDDSGTFANDGECDDPRFGGFLDSHEMADATDCSTALEAGDVVYSDPAEAESNEMPEGEIDFGDDSGGWSNDGECDDPRFTGPGVGVALNDHLMADATDCRTALEAGTVSLAEEGESSDTTSAQDIDFGDDSGGWANDGECDDPRFGGSLASHDHTDATDCRTAYEAGTVTYGGEIERLDIDYPVVVEGIDFGNDDGTYSMDDECDDPRFAGSGVGASLDDHLMADASDCSAAFQAGTVTLREDGGEGADFRINFGDDSSASAHDGVCDDPRFQGRGAALELLESDMLADASDCRAAHEAGTVIYAP